jgi:hypothetical protein
MSHDSRKIRFGLGMTSEIRPSGANPRTGSTATYSIRSHGPKTTGLATFGYLSITSSTTDICHRFCL